MKKNALKLLAFAALIGAGITVLAQQPKSPAAPEQPKAEAPAAKAQPADSAKAEDLSPEQRLYNAMGLGKDPVLNAVATCDTVFDRGEYAVRLIKKDGRVMFLGLNLLSDMVKSTSDRELTCFIETALLAKSQNLLETLFSNVKLTKGKIADFKSINPDTECALAVLNNNKLGVTWTLNGQQVRATVPISYESPAVEENRNRSQIEDRFIAQLRKGGLTTEPVAIDTAAMQPYASDIYIIPGVTYINNEINTNTYFCRPDTVSDKWEPVWSKAYPVQSIANLCLFPSAVYGDPKVEIKVRKHEYGKSETLTIPFSDLIAVARHNGCKPFFGVEKFKDGELNGALFFYNKMRGYDHVFRLICRPEEVIDGTGVIKAVASLYIPTNNIDDLFQPYVHKKPHEKINWKK